MTTKQPGVELPFAGSVLESLELMGKVWGGVFPQIPGIANPAAMTPSLPSMMVPTLDVDELDKRITDLRAVEQWLALNASILRASIQTLEVQRNTIATLRTLGGTFAAATAPASLKAAAQSPDAASPPSASAPAPAPRRARRSQAKEAAKETRPPNLVEMPMNPAAWWGTLQDQFTRIASAAAGETANKAPAESSEANKPAARKPPTKRST
ncbi:MAG TPA: PhaM family polyhydroxyalkanoate granule multifunctional regulatory protein [Burkholderiaceae bacterium]|nr:PhaM family polyhydroxyalkanoate granule multifunctional regulatory protein [Burkholderiaceae bacterium]